MVSAFYFVKYIDSLNSVEEQRVVPLFPYFHWGHAEMLGYSKHCRVFVAIARLYVSYVSPVPFSLSRIPNEPLFFSPLNRSGKFSCTPAIITLLKAIGFDAK